MKLLFGLVLIAVAVSALPLAQTSSTASHKILGAPTYYIVVEARTCESDLVRFGGASNLPPRAVISLTVNDFDEAAWKGYSDEVYASVDEEGFFEGEIRPKKGMAFRHNLILVADFTTYLPKQSATVLRIVGKKGEYLAGVENTPVHLQELSGLSHNPQLFQVSGWYYGIEAIARAMCQ
jgi:hypothetical protein